MPVMHTYRIVRGTTKQPWPLRNMERPLERPISVEQYIHHTVACTKAGAETSAFTASSYDYTIWGNEKMHSGLA